MKFVAEVTKENASISFKNGTIPDLLYAITMVVKAAGEAKALSISDRLVFQKYVRELLPELAFGSSDDLDFISFLLKSLLEKEKE